MENAPTFYPFSYPARILTSQQLQSFTHRRWHLQGSGAGSCAFRTPAWEVPTQQSHPVLLFTLEQWGGMFETSSYSGRSLLVGCTHKHVV